MLSQIGRDAVQRLFQPELLVGDEKDLRSAANYERRHGPPPGGALPVQSTDDRKKVGCGAYHRGYDHGIHDTVGIERDCCRDSDHDDNQCSVDNQHLLHGCGRPQVPLDQVARDAGSCRCGKGVGAGHGCCGKADGEKGQEPSGNVIADELEVEHLRLYLSRRSGIEHGKADGREKAAEVDQGQQGAAQQQATPRGGLIARRPDLLPGILFRHPARQEGDQKDQGPHQTAQEERIPPFCAQSGGCNEQAHALTSRKIQTQCGHVNGQSGQKHVLQ